MTDVEAARTAVIEAARRWHAAETFPQAHRTAEEVQAEVELELALDQLARAELHAAPFADAVVQVEHELEPLSWQQRISDSEIVVDVAKLVDAWVQRRGWWPVLSVDDLILTLKLDLEYLLDGPQVGDPDAVARAVERTGVAPAQAASDWQEWHAEQEDALADPGLEPALSYEERRDTGELDDMEVGRG